MSELIIVVVLVLVGGVFAGAEIAVVAMRKTRLEELADAVAPAGLLFGGAGEDKVHGTGEIDSGAAQKVTLASGD